MACPAFTNYIAVSTAAPPPSSKSNSMRLMSIGDINALSASIPSLSLLIPPPSKNLVLSSNERDAFEVPKTNTGQIIQLGESH